MSTFISQRLRELEAQREYEFEKEALSLAPVTKAWSAFKGWRTAREAAKNSGIRGTFRRWTTPDKVHTSGPAKGSLVRDEFGNTVSSGKPSLLGSMRQGLRGGTPTRYDHLYTRGLEKEYKASQKGVGFLDRPGQEDWLRKLPSSKRNEIMSRVKADALAQSKMSKMDFLKHNKGEAARWYGKQIGYKGLTYGMPAYDVYDAATDPNRSVGEALGSAAGGILGMGLTGKAGLVPGMIGSVGGSIAGGALAGKAESALRGQKQVPPPQFVPPPTLHAYQPQQPYQNPYGQG